FDSLICTCWPMGAIARRIVRESNRRIDHVLAEGYPPSFSQPIQPGSRVVVLTDVVVSGQLLADIQRLIRLRDGHLVRCITIAECSTNVRAVNPPLTSLCDVSMRLDDPSTCARCGVLPLMEFNPLASHMTLRKKAARSPVQFLSENRQAAEFWQMVERTGAYEGHHRSGRSHYVAFV